MHGAILLVEDNDDDIDLTLRALNRSHLSNDIVVARDGREALAYLRRTSDEDRPLPVLILLDLRLPKVDGIEVLRKIREDARTRHLPVIVMTASRHEEDRFSSEFYGASAFMVKPGDYDQLMAAVKKLGLYWAVSPPPAPRPELPQRLGLTCRYAAVG